MSKKYIHMPRRYDFIVFSFALFDENFAESAKQKDHLSLEKFFDFFISLGLICLTWSSYGGESE